MNLTEYKTIIHMKDWANPNNNTHHYITYDI